MAESLTPQPDSVVSMHASQSNGISAVFSDQSNVTLRRIGSISPAVGAGKPISVIAICLYVWHSPSISPRHLLIFIVDCCNVSSLLSAPLVRWQLHVSNVLSCFGVKSGVRVCVGSWICRDYTHYGKKA